MPKFDIPADDNESVNSSLLSLSSNENSLISNYSFANNSHRLNTNSPPIVIERSSRHFNLDVPFVCREPTLDAVLRKVCNGSDMNTLTHIQMRVSPNVFGLHQMHIFLPSLIALNLDGSYLESLRDLGCDMKLKYLNVSRCQLRNFDGISGFESLEHLVADANNVSNVMQLSMLQELHTLSLRGNKIKQLNVIDFLSTCKKLNNMDLSNNPIVNTIEYRQRIKARLPSLLILDGFGFDDSNDNSNNLTECSSSLTSDISKDSSSLSDQILNTNIVDRSLSVTNQFTDTIPIDSIKRPSTAGSSSCHSTGEPIVGNIVNKVRRNRGQKKSTHEIKQSESSSTSLTSLLESNMNQQSNSNKFPMILPQSSIPLELGVINTEIMKSCAHEEQDVHQLIEMCRRWRELSQKTRLLNINESNQQQHK